MIREKRFKQHSTYLVSMINKISKTTAVCIQYQLCVGLADNVVKAVNGVESIRKDQVGGIEIHDRVSATMQRDYNTNLNFQGFQNVINYSQRLVLETPRIERSKRCPNPRYAFFQCVQCRRMRCLLHICKKFRGQFPK